MPTALFLSPHLDDVAFSCGGLAALLADAGWETVLVTAFTRSVVPASGFALACQLDKGLPAEIDYMAIRRAEDLVAAEILGFDEVLWLDLLEAPHRGYDSAAALFGAMRADDDPGLVAPLRHLLARYSPELVLAPQGLGGHVDHIVMIEAVRQACGARPLLFYRDTPYAIRNPAALPRAEVSGMPWRCVRIGTVLSRKIAAAQAYGSQIGFQFQGATAAALSAFAEREGEHREGREPGGGGPAERYLGHAALPCLGPSRALRQT